MQSDERRIFLNVCAELYAGVLAGLRVKAKAKAKAKGNEKSR